MVIGAKLTGTPGLTVPRYRFTRPVDVYHSAAAITAIADSTDVQLSDQIAPVTDRALLFVVSVQVIQAYSNGDGAAPIITLKGDKTGSVAVTAAGDAAGTFTRYQGQLLPGEKLLFTPTAGTGTTETGTARVSVTIFDPSPQ